MYSTNISIREDSYSRRSGRRIEGRSGSDGCTREWIRRIGVRYTKKEACFAKSSRNNLEVG